MARRRVARASALRPVAWLVSGDVQEARKDMNFTEWPTDDPGEVRDPIEEIGEQIEDDAMPPDSYRSMQTEARLSPEQRQILVDWSLATGGLDRLDELEGPPGERY